MVIKGLYTDIKAEINKLRDEGKLVIDVNKIIDTVKKRGDVYGASFRDLLDTVLLLATEVTLFGMGYRSVVRGAKLFVNMEDCDNPDYLAHMLNNECLSEAQKEQAKNMIKKSIKEKGLDGQMQFDFIEGTVVESVSEQELIEMLRKEA